MKNYRIIKMLLMLSGDIEQNPGPTHFEKDYMLMTQNCRGLNNNAKLLQLLRDKNRLVKNKRYILALQETYLVESNASSTMN